MFPSTEATDVPNPVPSVAGVKDSGAPYAWATNPGGTLTIEIVPLAWLVPPKPSVTVSVTVYIPGAS